MLSDLMEATSEDIERHREMIEAEERDLNEQQRNYAG